MIYQIIKHKLICFLFKTRIKIEKIPYQNHIFLTAANQSFANQLFVLLCSIRKYDNDLIVVYDLGLNKSEIIRIKEKINNIEIIKFDFSKYPSHFDLNINFGSYAWKVALIHEAFEKYKYNLTYLDARNYITESFSISKYYLFKNGYYFPVSAGNIYNFTHPSVLQYFNIENDNIIFNKNLNASYFSISYSNIKIRNMVTEWFTLSLQKQIIAPLGADRSNHRYDQSLLTCLFYLNYTKNGNDYFCRRINNCITHFDVKYNLIYNKKYQSL